MKESLRDKTRDDLTFALNAAGVGSEMSDRGRVEEKVENSWYQRSLGIIDDVSNDSVMMHVKQYLKNVDVYLL